MLRLIIFLQKAYSVPRKIKIQNHINLYFLFENHNKKMAFQNHSSYTKQSQCGVYKQNCLLYFYYFLLII
jgi:hypothetical protein